MSEAPERIWTEPGLPGYTDEPNICYTVEYARADLLKELEDKLAKVAAGLERAKTFFQVTHCHASIDDTIAELSSVSCANSKGKK